MQDIVLLKDSIDENHLSVVDHEEGIMEFTDFNIFSGLNIRRQDKVDARDRLCEQMDLIRTELQDIPTHFKKSALMNYMRNLREIDSYVQSAEYALSRRKMYMHECIDKLTKEEIDTLGLNVNYEEFSRIDFNAIAYKEKHSLCIDSELIASLESAYDKDID
jgi:hypothetical protein